LAVSHRGADRNLGIVDTDVVQAGGLDAAVAVAAAAGQLFTKVGKQENPSSAGSFGVTAHHLDPGSVDSFAHFCLLHRCCDAGGR
jgi:hypothetical protein